MAMAFIVFGKKRRDREPTAPDDVLAANAARGAGLAPNAPYARVGDPERGRGGDRRPGGGRRTRRRADGRHRRPPAALAPAVADGGAQGGPDRGIGGAAAVSLRFTGDAGVAVDGMERRLIRYRLVSLLDLPDEVRGNEIGALDEGDEVVLLEKRGTYWRVLCPDGRQGWLHKMTLGDVVIDPSTQAGDSWTSGDDGPRSAGSRTSSAPTPRSASSSARPSPSPAPPSPGARSAPCAARRCAGGRCWARTSADSRTAAAACPPGTTRCRPSGTRPTASARAARSDGGEQVAAALVGVADDEHGVAAGPQDAVALGEDVLIASRNAG